MKIKVLPSIIALLALILLLPTISLRADNTAYRHIQFLNDRDAVLGSTQVWDAEYCPGDIYRMAFATNDGLYIYNGIYVRSLKQKHDNIIRVLRFEPDSGRLYSAGVNSFGWWAEDEYGQMCYHPIYTNIGFRSSSYDFWRIGFTQIDGTLRVLFQCRELIYIYSPSDGSLSTLSPRTRFNYLYDTGDGEVYFQDGNLLCSFSGGERREICKVDGRLVNIVRTGESRLAAVEGRGVLEITEGGVQPYTGDSPFWGGVRVTTFKKYDDSTLLFGTSARGLYMMGKDRCPDNSFIDSSLSHSTILCCSRDPFGNIYAGMDSGVVMIDNGSPDYYISDESLGQIHKILRLDSSRFLIGSNKGIFLRSSGSSASTRVVSLGGHLGSVWDLSSLPAGIFVCCDKGLFTLDGSLNPSPLFTRSGVFCIHPLHNDPSSYILGTYSGLALLRLDRGEASVTPISNYKGFTRKILVDEYDRVWVTVAKVGFVRLTLSEDFARVVDEKAFDLAEDEPYRDVFTTLIDGKQFLCSSSRAYSTDNPDGLPVESTTVKEILDQAGPGVTDLAQEDNRFWYAGTQGCGCIEREGTELRRHHSLMKYAPRQRLAPLCPLDGGCVMGYRNGIAICRPPFALQSQIAVSGAVAKGQREDIRYCLRDEVFTVPSVNNSIYIYLSCNNPEDRNIQYRVSPSEEWTTMSIEDCIQIPSLPSGRHSVEIRSQSNPKSSCHFNIKVKSPWYVSAPMCLLYVLVLISVAIGLKSYYMRKERRLREQELKRLEYQNLLQEKKISEIEKEKLRAEVQYKGQELANIALNASRRNNLITGLIAKLRALNTEEDASEIRKSASALIGELEAQLKDESDWHKSESYFNTIYGGLLDRMKASYPNLSKTDLKLCVYIKLNMSTKEIAGLMNISPRSVEMTRYRLRKKLGLSPDEDILSILK